jgi:hypothetical protein
MYLFVLRGPFFYYYAAVYDMAASPPLVLEKKCDRNLLNNINHRGTLSIRVYLIKERFLIFFAIVGRQRIGA